MDCQQVTAWAASAIVTISAAAGSSRAQPVKLTDVAPAESFLVVTIEDWSDLVEQIDGSALGRLWREPGVQRLMDAMMRDAREAYEAQLELYGLTPEDVPMPEGSVGLALVAAPRAAGEPGGLPPPPAPPGFVLVAEMGTSAARARDLIDDVLDHALDAGRIRLTTEGYRGVDLLSVQWAGDDQADPLPVVEELLRHIGQVHIAWLDDTVVMATGLRALEAAVEVRDGLDVRSIADQPAFADSLRQHERGAAAQVVVIIEPLAKYLIGPEFEQLMAFLIPEQVDLRGLLETLGLAQIEAASAAVRIDTGAAVVDQSLGLLVRERRGLVSLMDRPGRAIDPPAFVGADSAEYMRFSFDFAGLFGVAREVVARLPEDVRAIAAQQLDAAEGWVGPLFQSIGPDVYLITTYAEPLGPNSFDRVVVVPVSDELVVSNSLVMLAQATSMTTTDFEGHVIYRAPWGPIAAGQGFGHLYVGTATGVENAMRQAGAPAGPRLATEPRFVRAAAALPAHATMVSYAETRQFLRWTWWSFQQLDEADRPAWVEHLPPVEDLLRHLGDMVSAMWWSPEGLRGRWYLLPSAGP